MKKISYLILISLFLTGCGFVSKLLEGKQTTHSEIKKKGKIVVSIEKIENNYVFRYKDATYEFLDNYYTINLNQTEFNKFKEVLLKTEPTEDFNEYVISNEIILLVKHNNRLPHTILHKQDMMNYSRISFVSNNKMKKMLNKIK